MNGTAQMDLQPVELAHGVVLLAISEGRLIVGEVAGHAALLYDLLLYAERHRCRSILFHTSRKGLLVKALDATDRLPAWSAPEVVGYIVEVTRDELAGL